MGLVFLMQHYGAPTRLLDWTDGALVALYFAARDNKKENVLRKRNGKPVCDAAVWMLDPGWLNREAVRSGFIMLKDNSEVRRYLPLPFRKKKRPRLPVAIDPAHVDRRVTVQRGHFTLYGTDPDGLQTAAADARERRLTKLVVDGSKTDEILDQLATCGITETTVFPDLEGLSHEVEYFWSQ